MVKVVSLYGCVYGSESYIVVKGKARYVAGIGNCE